MDYCESKSELSDSRKYLSDPNIDVRVATENVLAEFLREIRDIAKVRRTQSRERSVSPRRDAKRDIDEEAVDDGLLEENQELEGEGSWIPGQGVFVDHAAIVEIMIHHLSYPGKLARWRR